MQRVRFARFGQASTSATHKVLVALNAVQDAFSFDLDVDEIPLPDGSAPYDDIALTRRLTAAVATRHRGVYPIGVCDVEIGDDDNECSYDPAGAVVSIYKWPEKFPGVSPERLLAFHVAGILLAMRVGLAGHNDEVRHCVEDYCDDPADRVPGVLRATYCADCSAEIRRAVQSGALPLAEASAVHRMLDWVAKRRRAFVVMPFDRQHDRLFEDAIRPTLTARKWECVRGDEVFEAADIVDWIWQEIQRCHAVVAVVSGGNPNVFYEIGYAQALGRPTVLLAHRIEEVPFDLRGQRVILYDAESISDGRLAGELARFLA